MIILADARKLGAVRTLDPGVLSMYLTVPLDPAELRGLPVRVDELIAEAENVGSGHVADEDRSLVREKLDISVREWLGRSVAVFACAGAGLFESFRLPCRVPDRAVLGTTPHVRPLLAAVQRCPAYRVAVVDRKHARLFHVAGDETEAVTAPVAASVRDTGFGGWDGLQAYRVQHRAARLARQHYQDTAIMLEKAMADGKPEPLVIGGRDEAVPQLLACLPSGIRERFAGSFAADARTVTAARVRELAAPLVTRWAERRADLLAEEVATLPPGRLAAAGLRACLAAVNARAMQTLIVPDDGLVPGFECGRCGALSVDADTCPDWATAARPIPDLIDEMVTRTLEDGGHVCLVHDGPGRIAARLRFQQPSSERAARGANTRSRPAIGLDSARGGDSRGRGFRRDREREWVA